MDLLLVDTRQVSVGMAEGMMALDGDMAQVLECILPLESASDDRVHGVQGGTVLVPTHAKPAPLEQGEKPEHGEELGEQLEHDEELGEQLGQDDIQGLWARRGEE